MNYATKTACAVAFVIAAFLFLAMGGDMWTGTMTGYGSMGNYGMTDEAPMATQTPPVLATANSPT
ncbi:MAG: hypothetical protein K0B16_01140 [Burkholderiaceae bacterium]|nr:hypothetical protein [Burkholderiaceae bacterium]